MLRRKYGMHSSLTDPNSTVALSNEYEKLVSYSYNKSNYSINYNEAGLALFSRNTGVTKAQLIEYAIAKWLHGKVAAIGYTEELHSAIVTAALMKKELTQINHLHQPFSMAIDEIVSYFNQVYACCSRYFTEITETSLDCETVVNKLYPPTLFDKLIHALYRTPSDKQLYETLLNKISSSTRFGFYEHNCVTFINVRKFAISEWMIYHLGIVDKTISWSEPRIDAILRAAHHINQVVEVDVEDNHYEANHASTLIQLYHAIWNRCEIYYKRCLTDPTKFSKPKLISTGIFSVSELSEIIVKLYKVHERAIQKPHRVDTEAHTSMEIELKVFSSL